MTLWPIATRFHRDGSLPLEGEVFVFGSNTAGIHGTGAALVAKEQFGAEMLVGHGRTGHAYAVATRNSEYQTLPLKRVQKHVQEFLEYANANTDTLFFITRLGCGLAGYEDREIAPMFSVALPNCNYPQTWKRYLKSA